LSQEASPVQFGACAFYAKCFGCRAAIPSFVDFFLSWLKKKKRDIGKRQTVQIKENKEKPHLEKKDIKKKEKEKERSKRKRKRRENFRSACILLGPCAECIVVCLN